MTWHFSGPSPAPALQYHPELRSQQRKHRKCKMVHFKYILKKSSLCRNMRIVTPGLEEEISLTTLTQKMMRRMKMRTRISTWWPQARMMRMKSVTMTPAERKCIRGSEMSAYSEKSQELCHILLPDREIHTEIMNRILFFLVSFYVVIQPPPPGRAWRPSYRSASSQTRDQYHAGRYWQSSLPPCCFPGSVKISPKPRDFPHRLQV